jgi:glutaredoxin
MNAWDDAPASSRRSGLLKTSLGMVGVAVFLTVVFFVARASNGGSGLPDGLVLYWGEGCPHCEKVEEFLAQNKLDAKFPITRKEVYSQKGNAREMQKIAKSCGLPADSISIPFLWTGKECLIGDVDIIAFFQKQL